MLKVLAISVFLLSVGGSYTSPVQHKSVKTNHDSMAKDVMMSDDQDDKTSVEVKAKDTVDLMAVMNMCNDSFRIEMAYIEALNESGSFPDETDRTPKCYVRCVLENTEVASEDGKYDPARAAEVFAGERGGKVMTDIQDLATACADRKESCKCERAYKFMKCLMESEINQYVAN